MRKVWSMLMLLTLCLVSCNNIDDLEDDVDALKKRVTALETQIKDINSNIEALRELYKEGTFITNLEEKADSYTLTLSNGKVVNLYMKNANNLLCPIIGIDTDGYWTVLYSKDGTPERLMVNGQPVKANGESGKTPTFNVDSEGYWQVSYDGGSHYEYIYKEGTQEKVSATGNGSTPADDQNFKSVTVTNNELVLQLAGDNAPTIRIPILSDFECSFATEDVDKIHTFAAGESKKFAMTIRGVDNTMITAPQGWSAKFSEEAGEENVLIVTAPASAINSLTRATADNSMDIAVLATSGKYAMIAKIKVKVGESAVDYYELYEANKDIIVGGNITINKSTHGEAILYTAENMTEDTDIRNDIHQKGNQKIVIFLEKSSDWKYISSAIVKIEGDVVIIGRNPNEKPVLQPKLCWNLAANSLILKNINLDLTNINGDSNATYMFNNANATADFNNLIIEDCEVSNMQRNLFVPAGAKMKNGINNISIQNNRFLLTMEDPNYNIVFFNLGATTNLNAYKNVTFHNNIIYRNKAGKGQLIGWTNSTVPSPDSQETIVTVTNNSIINFVGSNYYLKFYDAASLTITQNVFYADPACTLASTLCAIYKTGSNPTFNVKDNLTSGLAGENKWAGFWNNSTAKPSNSDIQTYVSENPFNTPDFSNGDFSLKSEYQGYGATIK